ncbi:MAG: gspG [Gemmatimonadetes bacterium]|nr:gspG [Gemmatimonadota bacterium]
MSPRRDAADPRRTGFTLIEMIVVLVVVGTLAGLVGPALFRHVGTARTQAARDELAMLDLAMRSYHLDNGQYPTAEQGLAALRTRPALEPVPWRWKGPYLRRSVPLDPWGRAYLYGAPAADTPGRFTLRTLGKDGVEGGSGEDADLSASPGSSASDSTSADSNAPSTRPVDRSSTDSTSTTPAVP